MQPIADIASKITPCISKGKVKHKMTFDDQLNILILHHLEEYSSGHQLLQALKEDNFARQVVAPEGGISNSAFFEAINSRGKQQLFEIFELLQIEAANTLPKKFSHLGDLVAIDGSLIDACLSMNWADYRKGSKKAKVHVGYNINNGTPAKIYLTDGKADERPFVEKIVQPGQTGVMDRYYQCHKNFDDWQEQEKHFVCRIQARTIKQIIEKHATIPSSIVFYDATVKLGSQVKNQTQKPVRVIAYTVDAKEYWIATDRFDLTAEEIAQIYKLRWDIESFFGWWKRHLNVYHLIARSQYGLMVQILAGLITYLLLAIYCHRKFNEKVSIKRVRELRFNIKNEASILNNSSETISLKNKRPDYNCNRLKPDKINFISENY